MKQYDVILRKIAIEFEITIKSIPTRLYAKIRNLLILFSKDVNPYSEKYIRELEFNLPVESKCGIVQRLVSERVQYKTFLRESVDNTLLQKTSGVADNNLIFNNQISQAFLIKYNRLSDLDIVNGSYTSLSSYDTAKLDDLDCIEV